MSAAIIPLSPDAYRPMSFSMTSDQAYAARADFQMASTVLLYAQQARMEALRGELTPAKRVRLLEAFSVILGQPRLK